MGLCSLLSLIPLALAATLSSVAASRAPNGSSSQQEATCSIPLENPNINLFQEWSAERADASDGFCYDNHGLGYAQNQTYIACEGCMEYICKLRACDDRGGSKHKLWWELDSVASQCCKDREDRVIPPNKGTTSQLGDSCQTVERTTCVTTADTTGQMEVSYQSGACCLDRKGWNPVGSSRLEAATCSDLVCEAGRPAVWVRKTVHQSSNCCAVRGNLVAPGGLFMMNGQNSTCCDGVMVMNSTSNLSACRIGDVVYLIDTSGSMSGSKKYWEPVALDILSEFKAAKMNINEFSLMDYVQKVSLKTKTTSMAEMSQAVKNLTFGGSNERTFAGLKSALQQSPLHNFIVLISDEIGDDTTDTALKADIKKLRDTTQSKIFFLMVPPSAATLTSMKKNFKDIGTVIDIKNTNTTIPQVIEALKKSAICTSSATTKTIASRRAATVTTTANAESSFILP